MATVQLPPRSTGKSDFISLVTLSVQLQFLIKRQHIRYRRPLSGSWVGAWGPGGCPACSGDTFGPLCAAAAAAARPVLLCVVTGCLAGCLLPLLSN